MTQAPYFYRSFLIASVCFLSCTRAHKNAAALTPKPILAAPHVVLGDLNAGLLLADIPSRAVELGAGSPSLIASAEAEEGERVGAFVDIPADVCLFAYARASKSVDDLDLAAFSDDGSPLVVDEATDAHPTVMLCPPHPDRVYVAAHVAIGQGLVAVATHLVPRERSTAMTLAFAARGGASESPQPADAWPGIDDLVHTHYEAVGGTWEPIRKVAIVVDSHAPSYVALTLDPQTCVDAFVVPDDEVGFLEVEALDAAGRIIARAKENGRTRSLTVCSTPALVGTLTVRPHSGRGLAAVVLARAPTDAQRDWSVHPDIAWTTSPLKLDDARTQWNSELTRAGYDPPSFAATGNLIVGRRVTVPLDLRPPAAPLCARIDIVGGTPLSMIESAAWDDNGTLVTEAEGTGWATMFACSRKRVRLELETHGHPGPFAVLERAERWQDPSFSLYPLAAARMLARAAGGGHRLFEGNAVSTKVVAVDSAHLQTWTENIPAGRCLHVTAGAEGDGEGLSLRLFEAESGDEVDRSQGAFAVHARACAPLADFRTVRIEIRGQSGTLAVVIGERLVQ